jgi:hypothetical protein
MPNNYQFESKTAVTVDGTWTALNVASSSYARDPDKATELPPLERASVLNLEVEVASGATLDGFGVQLKDHANGEWYDYIVSDSGGAGDFENGVSNLRYVTNTGPHEVASGGKAHAIMDLHAAAAIQLLAKTGGSDAEVKVRGTVRPAQ